MIVGRIYTLSTRDQPTAAVDVDRNVCMVTRERLAALEIAWQRYEFMRRLNVPEFETIFNRCLMGERFDDVVDQGIADSKTAQR